MYRVKGSKKGYRIEKEVGGKWKGVNLKGKVTGRGVYYENFDQAFKMAKKFQYETDQQHSGAYVSNS